MPGFRRTRMIHYVSFTPVVRAAGHFMWLRDDTAKAYNGKHG
jgi:hypothetical protein